MTGSRKGIKIALGAKVILSLEEHRKNRQDHPEEEENHALLFDPALGLSIKSRTSSLAFELFFVTGSGHGQSQNRILAVAAFALSPFKRLSASVVRHNTPGKNLSG